MSRGSYDPMNCTASCFVIGPHLMMVSETFPLHLFPLGLTTTEKDKGPTGAFTGPRDSSPGTPCVPQLGARRAYPHAPARSRGFPSARERCRPSGAARRSRDSRTRMPRASRPRRGVSPNATLKTLAVKTFSHLRSGARARGSRDGLPRECIGRRVRVRMP